MTPRIRHARVHVVIVPQVGRWGHLRYIAPCGGARIPLSQLRESNRRRVHKQRKHTLIRILADIRKTAYHIVTSVKMVIGSERFPFILRIMKKIIGARIRRYSHVIPKHTLHR